jgi:Fic family protein
LGEHFEVINHRDGIEYVEALANSGELLTPFQVRQIHELVLSRIDDDSAGKYRETQVLIAGAAHTP